MNPIRRRVAAALFGMSLIVTSFGLAPAASAQPIFHLAYVDLKVERADYYYQPVTTLLLAKGDYMKFVVKNAGNVASGPSKVAVKNVIGGATLQTLAVPALGPGATWTLYHNLPDCNGYGKVNALRSIVVDSTNLVAEFNEANNTWSTFVCFDPPK